MSQSGLDKISPHRTDFDFLTHAQKTFGAVDPQGLPANFSIYDGQAIPNQNDIDMRFNPFLPPLPMGCTGEAGAFESGLQDGRLYNPKYIYDNTPPGGSGGRDIRAMLQFLIDHGPSDEGSTKRKGYFNVYGRGKITDYDAVKIALWVNQNEKRGVYIGSYFYPEFSVPIHGSGAGHLHVGPNGVVPTPSFNTQEASLHCWLVTGWKTIDGVEYLEGLTWQGDSVGFKGVEYFSYEIYNALMQQPWTGAFTISKYDKSAPPIALGIQVIVDHLLYFVRFLFSIAPKVVPPPPTPPALPPISPVPKPETAADRLANAAEDSIGKDATPLDKVPDEVACVESLVTVTPAEFGLSKGLTYTPVLLTALRSNPRFKATRLPSRGCIVVSPTQGQNIGHCGIFTSDTEICSNTSKDGIWRPNYTWEDWIQYFKTQKGLLIYLFSPVDIL